MKTQTQHYFGGCPECGNQDGYTNVGKAHWIFCKAHRTMWCIGWNLFSSWQYETEDEQRLAYDTIGLGSFTVVKPMPWRPTLRERRRQWRMWPGLRLRWLWSIGKPKFDTDIPF